MIFIGKFYKDVDIGFNKTDFTLGKIYKKKYILNYKCTFKCFYLEIVLFVFNKGDKMNKTESSSKSG